MTEVIISKVVMDKSAESPRGPKMEASVNEDTEEMAERNTLHGDGKYRAITEGDITRMNHERSGPSLKKKKVNITKETQNKVAN